MNARKIGRREFLQAAGAAALLTGLSHFRFLNVNANTALASPLDGCEPPAVPDYCNPGEDSDICPDPNASSSDVCVPERGEVDECIASQGEPDICDPMDSSSDMCAPAQGDPDGCERLASGQPETPDTCGATLENPDICPDGGPPMGDGDKCAETNPGADPDECIPAVNESDSCSVSAEPDFCRNPATGLVEHDLCFPTSNPPNPDICFVNGQNVEDTCNSLVNPPDDPNAVGLSFFGGQPEVGAASLALGGLAVLAGAAALARRAGTTRSEEDT